MSTEATGDGQTDTVEAEEPDVAAKSAEPPAKAVTELAAAEAPAAEPAATQPGAVQPGATGLAAAEEATSAPAQATPQATLQATARSADAGASGTGDHLVPDKAAEIGETPPSVEADGSDEIDDPDGAEEGADEFDEPGEPGDGYADDEASEYDEGAAQYNESTGQYDEYPAGELAEPTRTRRWPRAMLAVGFLVLAGVIVGGAVTIIGKVTHGFKKPVKIEYTKSAVFSLKAGECFDPQGQSYSLVSCDSPHVAEVFATFTLGGSTWPGTAAVAQAANSGCSSRLTGYLNPQLAISLSSTYVYPDSVAWQAGTRTVVCEVQATSGELTGSVQGASATEG